MRRYSLALLAFVVLLALGSYGARRDADLPNSQRYQKSNWLQFSTRSVDGPASAVSITPENISDLHVSWTISLPEIVDSAPLYASNVMTDDGPRDLLIVETMIGRVVAYDARDGKIVWHTEPPAGPRWTTSAPAIDPRAQSVYAYCLDGRIHRYALSDGAEITGDGWPVLITKKGDVEKGSSNIAIATARNGQTYLYMTIAAYPEPGDDGDYQGHLVTVSLHDGAVHVFNALCSDRDMIFDAGGGDGDCGQQQAGIWARTAAAYDGVTDRVFVTTGNGAFDADQGGFNWGTSVVALRPDGSTDGGTPLDSWTPWNYQALTDDDADLSSTTIAILPTPRRAALPRLGVQSGKDGTLRLLNLGDLSGTGGPRAVGGELQAVGVPQGGGVFTQPATIFDAASGGARVFIANHRGVSAMQLVPNPDPHLETMWISNDIKGTSPVLANGLLYVAGSGAVAAFDSSTGAMKWGDTSIGAIHWQSPIVVNGRLFLCDQGAKLYAYTLQ
jgi:outer membrane protein assembly factor BamB